MQNSDWKLIGAISGVLGFIFLVSGAYVWENASGNNGLSGYVQFSGDSGYVAPLLVSGVIFLVVGIGLMVRPANQSYTKSPPQPNYNVPIRPAVQTAKYCRYCGKELTPESTNFCTNCGQKIQ